MPIMFSGIVDAVQLQHFLMILRLKPTSVYTMVIGLARKDYCIISFMTSNLGLEFVIRYWRNSREKMIVRSDLE
jgi:hypothetical protein